jgi:tetratricopeptide (TPR) repeat protein
MAPAHTPEGVKTEQELKEAARHARGEDALWKLIGVLGELTHFYQSSGDPFGALEALREAVTVARRSHHPNLRPILLTRKKLEALLDKGAETAAGAEELRQLGASTSLGDRLAHSQAFAVHAAVFFHAGKLEQAERQYRRAVAAAAQLLGENHECTLMLNTLDDSLLRCGLALAGANPSIEASACGGATSEGLLWGIEVLELDLRSTDMVVLSACHTEIGESRLGEGAVSLRRAFRIAGARSVVSSMWEVSDGVAQELMGGFYDRLLNEELRAQALWQSKQALRHKYPHDPFLWGSFVLEGNPFALDRFKPIKAVQLRVPKAFNEMIAEQRERDRSEAAWLLQKAQARNEQGHVAEALSLFKRVKKARGAKRKHIDKADFEIACIHWHTGKVRKARELYTKLLERSGLGIQLWLNAHFYRGLTQLALGELRLAIEDYTAILLTSETCPEEDAQCLVNRGSTYWALGDIDAALDDFASVISDSEAPLLQKVKARTTRSRIFSSLGDDQNAIVDCSTNLATAGIDEVLRCTNYYLLRAAALIRQGKINDPKADLSVVRRPPRPIAVSVQAQQLWDQLATR